MDFVRIMTFEKGEIFKYPCSDTVLVVPWANFVRDLGCALAATPGLVSFAAASGAVSDAVRAEGR